MHSGNAKAAFRAALTAFFVTMGAGFAHAEMTLFGAGHVGPDGPSFLYRIDPATGRVTPIGAGIGFDRVSGLEYDWTSGTLYGTGERTDGSDTHVLITIDPATGLGTEVGPTGIETFRGGFDVNATMSDIAIRPSDGTLFGWHYPSYDRASGLFGGLSTINLGTGAATLIGYSTGVLADDGSALAFGPSGVLFYAASETPGGTTCSNGWGTRDCDDVLHKVDTATVEAMLHRIMDFPPAPPGVHNDWSPRISDMDFDPETGTMYASVVYGWAEWNSRFLGTLDTETGDVKLIGPMAKGLDAIAVTDLPVVKERDDVVIDFGQPAGGAKGIWNWMNDGSWERLHPASSQGMVTGDLDAIPPVSANSQTQFRGLQTRISSIDGPTEGGAISATFDNVRVNGVPYEDFASGPIDRDKWADLEFIRTIEGGQLRSELTRFGSSGSNTLNFLDANAVNSFRSEVTVTDVQNVFVRPRARLTGFFYNDGTAGVGESGEVQAEIGLRHNGSILTVAMFVGRCDNFDCSSWTEFFWDDTTFVGPVVGVTYTLSIDFDGTTFTFGFDGATFRVDPGLLPPVVLPSQYQLRTDYPFKGIGVRVSGSGDPKEGAHMSARFDNVWVNGAPYDDFNTGPIDSSKWFDLEFVRQVEAGQLDSELRRLRENGSNIINFANTGAARSFEADVTVMAIDVDGAAPSARLAGFFYNDGTPGDDNMGEIYAGTGIGDHGNDLRWFYVVARCTNPECTLSDIIHFDEPSSGPLVALGETHRLSLAFDGESFTFGFDGLSRTINDDVVIDFGQSASGAKGLWKRMNDSAWERLHPSSAEGMATGDLDGTGQDDVVIDFGTPLGLWQRMNDSAWVRLHAASPGGMMVTGDLDGSGKDDVVIDFGQPATSGPPFGIWKRMNDSAWVKLHNRSAEGMATGDLDGNGKDDVVIDFGTPLGLWQRMNDSAWVRLHAASPGGLMVTGDLDGSGQDDVVIDFGQPASGAKGLWKRMNDSAWVRLHPSSAEGMTTGDLDGNGKDDVVIDFGAPLGLWKRMNDSAWVRLHPASPGGMMVTGNLDAR